MRQSFRPLAALFVAGWVLWGCDSPSHPTPDTKAPIVQVASPASGSTLNTATATLTGTAADSAGVTQLTVQVNGGAEQAVAITAGPSVAFTATVPLVLGQNTVTVNAFDAAGNRGTATLTLTRANPAPALVGFSIDPDSVDARTTAKSAQLTFRASSAAQVTGVSAILVNQSGMQLGCSAAAPVSTDGAGVGTYVCTVPVPTSTRAGAYVASTVTVNQTAYTTAQLTAAGYETRLAVASIPPPGQSPPEPLSLTFAPDPVMVTTLASVTFTARVADADGVGGMYVFLISPQGGEVGRCSVAAPGNPTDVTLQCSILFRNSLSLQPGTLRVALGLYDKLGYYQFYNPDALAARGFDTTLQVDVDTTPASLVGFDLVPDSVDVRTTFAQVQAVFRVSHGFRANGATVNLVNAAGNTLNCSANGGGVDDGTGVLTFRCTITLQPSAPTGPYTVTVVSLGEGNPSYNTSQLSAAGFDTVLKVVSASTPDDAPPTVAGLTFAPDPVVVSGSQASVTFDVRLSDPGSGAKGMYVFLLQNGQEARRCSSATLVSGTPADGTFRCTVVFANGPNLQPATYSVAVGAYDVNGNYAFYSPATLAAAGFDTSLQVNVDTTPSTLVGFTFAPDSVDVRTTAATVTFTMQVSNGYRVSTVPVILRNAGGEEMSCEATRVSTDGAGVSTFSCTIGVPTTRGAGPYSVFLVRAGGTDYLTSDLQAAGYPTQLEVVSNLTTDRVPPVVAALSFVPDPLSLGAGDQTLVFTARLTDDSGVGGVIFFLVRPDGSEYKRCNTATIFSGTPTDATYRCSMPVSGSAATTPPGNYRVAMSVYDVRGNERFYTADQLAAQGFDTTLTVQP